MKVTMIEWPTEQDWMAVKERASSFLCASITAASVMRCSRAGDAERTAMADENRKRENR